MSELNSVFEIKNISKFYTGTAGSKLHVLDEVSFKIEVTGQAGSIISVLAPFGSGKSTLLKIIAAIEEPTDGGVFINGALYSHASGKIAYIPELPSSFPWLNVKQNIEFVASLKSSGNIDVNKLISIVGLTGYEDHFPHEKSIGFRFRISLARALAVNPSLILLDDPFRGLHGETKKEIYSLLQNVKEKLKTNFLLTTTNITEAISLSDKILLMKNHPGKIFKEIIVNQNLISSGNREVFISLRTEIESAYSAFEGTPLVSEVKYK